MFSGLLLDVTQNEKTVYYYMGAAMTIGAFIMIFEPLAVKSQKLHQKSQDEEALNVV